MKCAQIVLGGVKGVLGGVFKPLGRLEPNAPPKKHLSYERIELQHPVLRSKCLREHLICGTRYYFQNVFGAFDHCT